MAEIDGFEHVNVTVRNVRASAAWYAELLGLERVWEEDSEEHGWIKVGLYHPASRMRLNLTQHRAGSGEPFDERRTGLDHLAFRVRGGPARAGGMAGPAGGAGCGALADQAVRGRGHALWRRDHPARPGQRPAGTLRPGGMSGGTVRRTLRPSIHV